MSDIKGASIVALGTNIIIKMEIPKKSIIVQKQEEMIDPKDVIYTVLSVGDMVPEGFPVNVGDEVYIANSSSMKSVPTPEGQETGENIRYVSVHYQMLDMITNKKYTDGQREV